MRFLFVSERQRESSRNIGRGVVGEKARGSIICSRSDPRNVPVLAQSSGRPVKLGSPAILPVEVGATADFIVSGSEISPEEFVERAFSPQTRKS